MKTTTEINPQLVKQLRDVMVQMRTTPEELSRLLPVLARRRP